MESTFQGSSILCYFSCNRYHKNATRLERRFGSQRIRCVPELGQGKQRQQRFCGIHLSAPVRLAQKGLGDCTLKHCTLTDVWETHEPTLSQNIIYYLYLNAETPIAYLNIQFWIAGAHSSLQT